MEFIHTVVSTGAQYIDTGFNPNQDTKMAMTVAYLGIVGNNIAGVRNTSGDTTNRFGLITFGSASKVGAFFQSSSIQAVAYDNKKHEYELDKNGLVVDGTAYGSDNSGTFTSDYPITLFGWNEGSGGVTATASQVYSCQIYDNEVLVRDYRPCVDDNGVVCMYDKVNETYYYNAGTGAFEIGFPQIMFKRRPLVETVKPVAVTITGTGNATYCCATINGTNYSAATSGIEVMPGDTITFAVRGANSALPGVVSIDGTKVLTATTTLTKTYAWTVPNGVTAISIALAYSEPRGTITVTTS